MSKMFVVAALVVAFCAIPSTVRAQEGGDDAEVTKMAKEHYRAGLEAYKAGQYDVAIKELKRAYLLKRLPALLLNIGATYRKMGDLDLALHFYKKYLDEAPPEAHDRGDVEATVKEIEAEKGGGGSKEATTPPPETPPTEQAGSEGSKDEAPAPRKRAAMPSEWSHTVVDAAPPNVPLDVRVSMPVMKGVKVYVFYRASGESDFQQVLMKRHGAEKIGRIPGDAMNGNAMQYYIEARDGAGQVVKSSGSQTSPNIVMIDPNAPPQMVASLDSSHERGGEAVAPEPSEDKANAGHDDEEAPLLVEGKKAKRERERRNGGGGGGGGGHLLRWVGVGLLAGGAAVAAGVGGAMFYEAKVQSDAVSQDSKNGGFLFNDPTVHNTTGDDSKFQSKGKTYNTVGIAMTAVGSAVAVAGLALVVVDVVRGGGGGSEKAKKPKHPREEESSLWYVAPTVSQQQVGVGGGFSF